MMEIDWLILQVARREDGKVFTSMRHALAFIIKNGAEEEEVRSKNQYLPFELHLNFFLSGVKDARVHGVGGLEDAHIVAH